jgi:hypothetical protein
VRLDAEVKGGFPVGIDAKVVVRLAVGPNVNTAVMD